MSFADPQSLTFATQGITTISLPKTKSGPSSGVYHFDNGTTAVDLSTGHLYGKRTRRTARVDVTKIGAAQLDPTKYALTSFSCYVVFDVPNYGFTAAEVLDGYKALAANLSASTYANTTKLLGGES